ncbi:hypothetical protein D9M68_809180 [compost metagenome]
MVGALGIRDMHLDMGDARVLHHQHALYRAIAGIAQRQAQPEGRTGKAQRQRAAGRLVRRETRRPFGRLHVRQGQGSFGVFQHRDHLGQGQGLASHGGDIECLPGRPGGKRLQGQGQQEPGDQLPTSAVCMHGSKPARAEELTAVTGSGRKGPKVYKSRIHPRKTAWVG